MSELDPKLLADLACPACRGELALEEGGDEAAGTWLVCRAEECRRRYPVRDGVPVLMESEATRDSDAG